MKLPEPNKLAHDYQIRVFTANTSVTEVCVISRQMRPLAKGDYFMRRLSAVAVIVLLSVTVLALPQSAATQPKVAGAMFLSPDPTATNRPDIPAIPVSANAPPRRHPLSDVAAIVEADVTAVTTSYDNQTGPRTTFTFANAIAHVGNIPSSFQIAQLGGPMADAGTYLGVSELPHFAVGGRYIVFLSNIPWTYTPIWTRLAFAILHAGGREIVVGPDGFAVLHFGTDGVRFGTTPLMTYSNEVMTPNATPTIAANIDSIPEISIAMAHDAFVKSATDAMTAIGGAVGATIPLSPDRTHPWNVHQTAAVT
jgi:hypothetical protein